MIWDVILGVLSLLLSVGFYTNDLDWVLIYYGCAPEIKKSKMDGKKIMGIACLAMFNIGMALLLAATSILFNATQFQQFFHVVALVLLIVMVFRTVKLCKEPFEK